MFKKKANKTDFLKIKSSILRSNNAKKEGGAIKMTFISPKIEKTIL